MVHLMSFIKMKQFKNNKIKKTINFALVIGLLINIIFGKISIGAAENETKDADIFRKHVNTSMKIALTFDDGPHPSQTLKILDVLDKYGIKATFFVVGVNATYYPEAFAEVCRRGHEIGNHTFSHPQVSKLNPEDLEKEVDECENTLLGLSDIKTSLFRPPEGMIDSSVKRVLGKLDYKVILWDIDTRDWAHTPPKAIANNVISHISSGDIILMHDYIAYNSPTVEALELFIPVLLEKGYTFTVISDLLNTK